MLLHALPHPATLLVPAHLSVMKVRSSDMSFSGGRRKSGGRLASQYTAARALPMADTNATCSGSHVSCTRGGRWERWRRWVGHQSGRVAGKRRRVATDALARYRRSPAAERHAALRWPARQLTRLQLRTLDTCTPRLRCTPARRGRQQGAHQWAGGTQLRGQRRTNVGLLSAAHDGKTQHQGPAVAATAPPARRRLPAHLSS